MSRVHATAGARMLAGAAAGLALLALPLGTATARAAGQPRIAIILLDTNISPAKSQMADERQAALAYLRALPADVEVGLIAFNDSWQTLLSPTASRTRLAAALEAAKPGGATSKGLRGALADAVATIGRLGGPARSRILVLSDGEFLTTAGSAVSVPTDVVSWYYDTDDDARTVRQIASASGGHAASPAHAASLAGFFHALAKPKPKPAPTRRPAVAAPSWRLTGSLINVLAVVFVAFLVLALLLLRSLRTGDRRPRLVGQFERYGPNAAAPSAASTPEGDGRVARTAVGLMTQLLSSRNSEPKLAQRLDRAGITRLPAEWALLGACVSIGLAAAFTILLGNVFFGVVIGLLGGWLGMRLLLSVKIGRRQAGFDEQLPNVLQLVAGSIQTGLSLAQGLDAVVREDTQPASGEFARALAETRLGVDLVDALDGVADRLQSSDLRWVIMAIRIQRETGGNLAEVLRNTVATMRERAYLRRQVRSLSAEGRLSAYVLLALPVLVGGWLFFASPTYMRPLYTTFFGLAMLATASVLVVVGTFWMRNLIKMEA